MGTGMQRTGIGAISALLDEHERTITWLAKKTGVSVSHLWRVTKGRREMSVELATRIAEVFEVPVETFLGEGAGSREQGAEGGEE